jgi:hypothetical protein
VGVCPRHQNGPWRPHVLKSNNRYLNDKNFRITLD